MYGSPRGCSWSPCLTHKGKRLFFFLKSGWQNGPVGRNIQFDKMTFIEMSFYAYFGLLSLRTLVPSKSRLKDRDRIVFQQTLFASLGIWISLHQPNKILICFRSKKSLCLKRQRPEIILIYCLVRMGLMSTLRPPYKASLKTVGLKDRKLIRNLETETELKLKSNQIKIRTDR